MQDNPDKIIPISSAVRDIPNLDKGTGSVTDSAKPNRREDLCNAVCYVSESEC